MLLNLADDCKKISDIISSRPSFLKIILKTKNDPIFLDDWIQHHAHIVGIENLIIFDNFSTDDKVLKYYAEASENLLVAKFSGFHNLIHDRTRHAELYAAICASAEYSVFLDTDERLCWTDGVSWCADHRLVEKLETEKGRKGLPTFLLNNYPQDRSVFEIRSTDHMRGCLQWGKPILGRQAHIPGGDRIHNCQYPEDLFDQTQPLRFLVLHLVNLSRDQRLAANKAKLVARTFCSDRNSYADIASRNADQHGDPVVRRCVQEIRKLLSETDSPRIDHGRLPPGTIHLRDSGLVGFPGEEERSTLATCVAGGSHMLNELVSGMDKLGDLADTGPSDRPGVMDRTKSPAIPDGLGDLHAIPEKDLLSWAFRLRDGRRFQEAEAVFRVGVNRFPKTMDQYGHPTFRKELMRMLLSLRQWDRASALAPSAMDSEGGDWHEILYARARMDAGDVKEGVYWWRQIMAKHPYHEEANIALGGLPLATLEDRVRQLVLRGIGDQRRVTFVQVGANDGTTHDPLSPFILGGSWEGVLIEPIPDAFQKLVANYQGMQGLKFENCAIGAEPGSATFYMPSDGNTRIGSFSRDHVLAHYPNRNVNIVEIVVPVLPISAIIDKYSLAGLDVLCIDAEGYDDVVLKTLNLNSASPHFIQFEHKNLPSPKRKSIRKYLSDHGYASAEIHWNTLAAPSASVNGEYLAMLDTVLAAHKRVMQIVSASDT